MIEMNKRKNPLIDEIKSLIEKPKTVNGESFVDFKMLIVAINSLGVSIGLLALVIALTR